MRLTGWYIHHNETDSDAKYCGCVTFVKGRAQSVVNGHFDSKKCPKFSFLGNSGNSSGIQQVFGKQGMKPDPIPGEFAEGNDFGCIHLKTYHMLCEIAVKLTWIYALINDSRQQR